MRVRVTFFGAPGAYTHFSVWVPIKALVGGCGGQCSDGDQGTQCPTHARGSDGAWRARAAGPRGDGDGTFTPVRGRIVGLSPEEARLRAGVKQSPDSAWEARYRGSGPIRRVPYGRFRVPLLSGFGLRDARRLAVATPHPNQALVAGRKRYPTPYTASRYWCAYTPSFRRSPCMCLSSMCERGPSTPPDPQCKRRSRHNLSGVLH